MGIRQFEAAVGEPGVEGGAEATYELGRVALHLDQGSAKRGLLLSLRQGLLEQATETALLPLDSQQILDLLARTRTWDFRAQKQTT